MIKHIIAEYGHFGLLFIILIYTGVKAIYIHRGGLGKHFSELFIKSLVPISKQGIKNTFQEKIKKYYKKSNVINYCFYVVLIADI